MTHITPQDLQALAGGQFSREAKRTAVAHLLHGCGVCQSQAADLWQLGPSPAPPADAYDAVFDRLSATLNGGKTAVEVEALLQRAWSLRHDNPEEMRRTARLAVLAASGLSCRTELMSRALAVYGNACRIAGDLAEAQESLDRAAAVLGPAGGNPEDPAPLSRLPASPAAAPRGAPGLAGVPPRQRRSRPGGPGRRLRSPPGAGGSSHGRTDAHHQGARHRLAGHVPGSLPHHPAGPRHGGRAPGAGSRPGRHPQ